MTSELDKIVKAFDSFHDEALKSGVSRQALARFVAGLAGGIARAAGFSWEEFAEMTRRGWANSQDPPSEKGKPS